MTQGTGIVYILGAGPGDPALLTQQAVQILQVADVLVYDALVNAQILNLLPAQCERIYMGKRGGQPSVSQPEINAVLVAQCQTGKTVVRLKSGDPFVFGRCRSELQALLEANCRVSVLPGLSSAIAGPTLAGIPLTDPAYSNGFAVVSAHRPDDLAWSALAQLDTLVILMGTQTLVEIVTQLLQHGKPATTAIAVLRWASQPDAQTWQGTLATIAELTQAEILSPAIIVVGEVVRLSHSWVNHAQFVSSQTAFLLPDVVNPSKTVTTSFLGLPLQGQTILVTRAAGQSSQFGQRLQRMGATVVDMPALEIQPPSSWEALDQAIANLSTFNWLVLTSVNAVQYFWERLYVCGKDTRSLAGLKIAVVGEKTAQALEQRGIKPDFIPPNFVADALVEHFPEPVAGQSFLFPRVETGGRDILVKTLTAQSAAVTEVAAYQSGCPAHADPEALAILQRNQVTIITFASSKTVHCFYQLVGGGKESWLEGALIASIGPQTSQTCQSLFGRVDIEATDYTLEGLAQAIAQAVNEKNIE